ncbi:MAG: serine/threonine-protein kinase [Myxococcota bacterium]
MTEREQLGPYELEARLGRGGTAEVFKAWRRGAEDFRRPVVLKRLLTSSFDPAGVRMFVEEARIAGLLDHPNIVRVEDFGRGPDGRPFLVMEGVGRDLSSVLGDLSRLGLDLVPWAALHIVIEVLEALDHLHALRAEGQPLHIVHRDVNPPNVLVSPFGQVKLADFGIARYQGKASTTLAGQLKGKVAYMAPEQIQGEAVDARTDLFGAGVMLWELLTGASLYGDLEELPAMMAICEEPRPSIRDHRPECSEDLDRLVMRALAIDPADRFPSAGAMQVELRNALIDIRSGGVRPRELAEHLGDALGEPHLSIALPVVVRASESDPDTEETSPPEAELVSLELDLPTLHIRAASRTESQTHPWRFALGEVRAGAARGRTLRLSADGATWRSLEQTEELLDHVLAPATGGGAEPTEIGRLGPAAVALLTRLSRDSVWGRLVITLPDGPWVEVEIEAGRAAWVRTSLGPQQLPQRIAALNGLDDRILGEMVQDSLQAARPLREVAAHRGWAVPDPGQLQEERLAVVVGSEGGDYALVRRPTAAREPRGPSLLTGLPAAVARAWPEDRLRAALAPQLNLRLGPTRAWGQVSAWLRLDEELKEAAAALQSAALIEVAGPAGRHARLHLALALVLVQAGALA